MKDVSLHILLLVGGYPTNENLARCVFNQRGAKELSKHHKVTVVFLRAWRPGLKILQRFDESTHEVIQLRLPFLPSSNKMKVKVFSKIGAVILRNLLKKIDIIHSIGANSMSLIGSNWTAKFGNKHVAQIIGSDVNSVLPVIMNQNYVKPWINNVHGISANSEALKLAFSKLYPNFEAPVEVIYRGVDTSRFKPSSKNKEKVDILFLGGLPDYKDLPFGRDTKGGLTLMKIWSSIEDKAFRSKARLLFGGPESDIKEVHDWVGSLKYKETVKLIGHLNPEEAKSCLAKSNVVILPSKEEGMPNVGVEALASGCAIIATDVGGLPELIDQGRNGYIYKLEDIDGMTKGLIDIIQNRDNLANIVDYSRNKAISLFDKSQYGYKLTELYKSL
ncbi:glycosyltransferase family 4 protein [Fulvivirga lutea]|uniref:Glycosyltransferase family 4 protein n=1 Tax=Fulvivirga lutea TaxID=2810512 RepID=A0A974WIJ9_9BACT|nr:glycosyltransferase family 4 protein [Fulvivirga lutea]QSE96800.1 glycosyltransferase family 4 protein [Fulvivirga lutea]